jgi:thiamine pyrophosphate-dependent acetolactate synthase large subunit-like protein
MLKILAEKVTDELVVTSIGRVRLDWERLTEPRDGNLYEIYMGGATSVALGIAVSLPHRKVIALDGDGGILMDLGILLAVGEQNPSNLIVIIGDNRAYEKAGCVPTFTADEKVSLEAIARGAGIPNAWTVRETSEFQKVLEEAYIAEGASFIDMKVNTEPWLKHPVTLDGTENKYRFIHHIEDTENIKVLMPAGMRSPAQIDWSGK